MSKMRTPQPSCAIAKNQATLHTSTLPQPSCAITTLELHWRKARSQHVTNSQALSAQPSKPDFGARMILVPVKNLSSAKQRLSPILSPEERFALAQAMCEDVLQALADWANRLPVAVVTSDPFARALATRFNFGVIADEENGGETSAIAMATAVCSERGARSTLVIPADIPLLEIADLQKIADSAPARGAVLVT